MKISSRASAVGRLSGRVLVGALFAFVAGCADDGGDTDAEQQATSDAGPGASGQEDAAPSKDETTTDDDEVTTDGDEATTDDDEVTTDDEATTDDNTSPVSPDTTAAPDSGANETDGESTLTGTVTPLDSPTECDLITKSVSSTYCELQEVCGDTSVYSSCSASTDDSWLCSCSGGARSGSYQLAGATGETACGVVRDLCMQGVSPVFDSELDCSTSYRSATTTSCQFQQTCTQSAAVGDGVTALASANYTSYCSDQGDNSLGCTCYGPGGTHYFDVTGLTGETACEAGMELCLPREAASAPVSSDCATSYENVSEDACTLQRTCTNTVDLGEGTAQFSDAPYGSCSRNANDELTCSCSANGRTRAFELQTGADGTTGCAQALDVCETTEAIQPSGEVECDATAQTVSTSTCQSTVQCKQSSTVNGVKIGVYGTVSTYCTNIEGEWTCDCASGTSNSAFNYLPAESADPWDACTEASTVCRQQVGVQISGG